MNEIKVEPDSDGEAWSVPQLGEYLFIDIKQEHYPASTSPAEPVTKNEDQVRMM
jgi:hypothetical protein